MVAPPVVIKFPAASLACTFIVVEEPELKEESMDVIRDVATLGAPGLTVIVGSVVVTVFPLMVDVMVVAVPERSPVNDAE
jgi:hypothetical protein